MGACSSVEVAEHDFPALAKPLPTGLTSTPPPSNIDAITADSHYIAPSTSASAEGSSVAASLLATLSAAANRASLSTSTAASASQRAANRISTSVSKANAQPTLRLASLTLEHDDDSADTNTASAGSSRRSTGEGKTEQARVAPLAATTFAAYKSNVSPKHADAVDARGNRGGGLLSGARQERLAAEERQQTAWQDKKGRVEEEKTQDDDGEIKRATGRSRFSLIKSKPQQPITPLKSTAYKPAVEVFTPATPPSVVLNYASVERGAARLEQRSGGMKKSASAEGGFTLPPAPAIVTQRVSSEVAILDVIRQLGRSQSVSVNTLSQYTRCVPAVLAGPSTRTPRSTGGPTATLPCCAKLQCAQCGMDVMMLDHHRWVAGVSQRTFACSYPEVARLRSSLQAAVGSRAYCCACSWVDVREQVVVNDSLCAGGDAESKNRINWICAGHQ